MDGLGGPQAIHQLGQALRRNFVKRQDESSRESRYKPPQ